MPSLLELLNAPRKSLLNDIRFAKDSSVLVYAPHPDDFDAVAATLKLFRDNGNAIHLCVLSGAASGVEDSFAAQAGKDKAELREEEQRAACDRFGLPAGQLTFLRLDEDDEGQLQDSRDNKDKIRGYYESVMPEIVVLPHGNDSNAGHRHAFSMLNSFLEETGYPAVGLLNRDPKTIEMRDDFFTVFDQSTADWKASLLRCHASQQQRNLNTRDCGFDQRVLNVNREIAKHCPVPADYAEAFELKTWNC